MSNERKTVFKYDCDVPFDERGELDEGFWGMVLALIIAAVIWLGIGVLIGWAIWG